jgi:hypothetical protein
MSAYVDEEGIFAHFEVDGRFQSWVVDKLFNK